jgi:hypothetical protein
VDTKKKINNIQSEWISNNKSYDQRDRARKFLAGCVSIASMLSDDDEGRRLLFAMPESAGDILLATSLLRSIKEQYPEYNIYFSCKPKFFDLLEGNPYIHKLVPYHEVIDNFTWMEGAAYTEKIFDISLTPYFFTQRSPMYIHNGNSNIAYNIRYEQ